MKRRTDELIKLFGGERRLAILVMDHRRKFSGSSVLSLWQQRWGEQRPEDVYPDLKGFDVDGYFEKGS